MKSKTLLLLTALCWSLISFGQGKRYVYYYNTNMQLCPKADAVFTGYGTNENNLYKLLIFLNATQKAVFIQFFTDSTLAINQGSYETYYVNGIKKEQGSYENNKADGPWQRWDSTGQMTDSINYIMGAVTDSSHFQYNTKGMVDGHRFTDVKNNSMHEMDYNDSGKLPLK